MKVSELKRILDKVPDEALVIMEGNHGTNSLANVKIGYSTEPNELGFCNFADEPIRPSYHTPAVIFLRRNS